MNLQLSARDTRPVRTQSLTATFLFSRIFPVLFLSGCQGAQSTLAPAGRGAEEIASLFWWMLGGGILIWIVVVGLAVYALRISPQPHDDRRAKLWIIGGGTIAPTIILTILLIYGLGMLPRLLAPPPAGSRQIDVVGLQWWWRVSYPVENGEAIELANEIRLPVGEPVQFKLTSADVIHAFWIPSLGGKVDMIPGRENRLTLEPSRTGTFRGACAEYCGDSHALMNFDVVVMEPKEFAAWLEHQQQPASSPVDQLAQRGEQLFLKHGCAACHTIRGTTADGRVGPDLTHVGSRVTLAAGALENHADHFQKWITHPAQTKPNARMPRFDMLTTEDLNALAAYLEGLQ